jgi:hypothetical protein
MTFAKATPVETSPAKPAAAPGARGESSAQARQRLAAKDQELAPAWREVSQYGKSSG